MLLIAEELLLLALDDEKGKVTSSDVSVALEYGLAGALLMELVFLERLGFDDKNILIKDNLSTGDLLLDEVLSRISELKKRTPDYLVSKLGTGLKSLRYKLLNRLIDKGILRKEENTVLWVFKTKRYPSIDSTLENEVRQHIKEVILNGKTPDTRMTVLISLIMACNLTNEIFSHEERKIAKIRIKEISKGDKIGKAVIDIVNSINAAVMAAVIASTIAVSSSSSN